MRRHAVRLVALDLDGVVWRGDTPLPGVPEVLLEVVSRGLDLRYVTNNSTAHREEVAKRLAALGAPAQTEWVLTSGFVAARWLREKLPPGAPIMVVGEQGLLRELSEAGFTVCHALAWVEERKAAAVVVGMDRSFNYAALSAAQAQIKSGALFVATNPDPTFPTPEGLKPGAGSLMAAVAAAAEQEPEIMGKPGLALAHTLEVLTGVSPGETLFVGDRLETDIVMGRRAGMITVLVLTGVTTREELARVRTCPNSPAGFTPPGKSPAGSLPSGVSPHYVLEDLSQLNNLLDALGG